MHPPARPPARQTLTRPHRQGQLQRPGHMDGWMAVSGRMLHKYTAASHPITRVLRMCHLPCQAAVHVKCAPSGRPNHATPHRCHHQQPGRGKPESIAATAPQPRRRYSTLPHHLAATAAAPHAIPSSCTLPLLACRQQRPLAKAQTRTHTSCRCLVAAASLRRSSTSHGSHALVSQLVMSHQ